MLILVVAVVGLVVVVLEVAPYILVSETYSKAKYN